MFSHKELCSLVDDVPLLGCKRPLEQEFPVDIDGKREFNSLCVVSGKGGMGLGNDNLCGIGAGDEVYTAKGSKTFEKLRCLDCRNCLKCKNGGSMEEISVQEEFEQNLINKCDY